MMSGHQRTLIVDAYGDVGLSMILEWEGPTITWPVLNAWWPKVYSQWLDTFVADGGDDDLWTISMMNHIDGKGLSVEDAGMVAFVGIALRHGVDRAIAMAYAACDDGGSL